MFKNALNGLWEYLKDWKNLLSHGIVEMLILAIGLMPPLAPVYRIIILVVVIALNTTRMKLAEKKAKGEE